MPELSLADSIFDGPPISAPPAVNGLPRLNGNRRPQVVDQAVGKRRDIQGLRMIAVVAVVVNHLTGHPKGGFLGVDVFFVISGYLITGLLLRDLGPRNGKTLGAIGYVWTFYRRRIRRILPAALVVIGLTILIAHSQFNSARYNATMHDGGWAAIFWANWHFVDMGTNYFTAGLPESPLQHFWSLSVEEQFYIAWPLAIFVIAVVIRQRSSESGRRLVAGIGALAVCAASLAFAFSESSSDSTTAYFSTFTRGWELGLGALAACVVPYLRANAVILTCMSWAGMTLILVSLFVVHGGNGFPAPGAILPCIGSALVIAAVSRNGARARNVLLTNWVAIRIGDVSYSVYLVHLPVIIFLATRMPQRGTYFYVAAVGLMLGLSILLYALVEQPILASSWLQPRAAPNDSAEQERIGPRVLAGASAAVLGLAVYSLSPSTVGAPSAAIQRQLNALATQTATPQNAQYPPALAWLQTNINSALRAITWPTLNPSMDKAITSPPETNAMGMCGKIALQPASLCTFGPKDAAHTAVLVGDSVSISYGEALRKVTLASPGWKLRVEGAFACGFADRILKTVFGTAPDNACETHSAAVVAAIKATHPDVVIVAALGGYSAGGSPLSDQAWAATVQGELEKIKADVGKIVILESPPVVQDPHACYTPSSLPQACVSHIPSAYRSRENAERAEARNLDGVYVPAGLFYCNADELCPAFVGRTPTRADQVHMTPQYADLMAPALTEAFHRARIMVAPS